MHFFSALRKQLCRMLALQILLSASRHRNPVLHLETLGYEPLLLPIERLFKFPRLARMSIIWHQLNLTNAPLFLQLTPYLREFERVYPGESVKSSSLRAH